MLRNHVPVYPNLKASAVMTMETINVLLGIISIVFALGVALGALAYAVEGIRRHGFTRRWNLFAAFLLGALAWSSAANVAQDFARASDVALLRTPANTSSFVAVAVWTLVSAAILIAGANYVRGLIPTRA